MRVQRLPQHSLVCKKYFISSQLKRANITTKAGLNVMDVTSLIGHSITYFTMFYCGLNWYYYRTIRKEQEKNNKKK